MNGERVPLETLDRKIAELASFLSPSEIFRALLEGTTAGGPRAAVFLLRDGRFKGWSSIGYAPEAAHRQRQAVISAESGWLPDLAAEDDVRWRTLTSGESVPDFGQGAYDEAVGLPLRVSGKTVAIVISERKAGEEPWSPAALSLLCQAARLRLELDLAWRRLKSLTESSLAPGRAQGAGASPPASGGAEAVTPSELTPWGDASSARGSDPRAEEARRYARLVATDIRLYNEEAVVTGRKQRDLASRLDEQMKRGRDAFARRFPEMGGDGVVLLEDAYVQVLAGGDPSLLR